MGTGMSIMTMCEILFCSLACATEKILDMLTKRYAWKKQKQEKMMAAVNVMGQTLHGLQIGHTNHAACEPNNASAIEF